MARRERPALHGDDHTNGVDPIPGFAGPLEVNNSPGAVDKKPTTLIQIGQGITLLDGGGDTAILKIVPVIEGLTIGSGTESSPGSGVLLPCSGSGVLLDYTDPTQPAVLEDGLYTINAVVVTTTAVAAGQEVGAELTATTGLPSPFADQRYVGPTGGGTMSVQITMPATWMAAGDQFYILGRTHSGSAPTFSGTFGSYITKILPGSP